MVLAKNVRGINKRGWVYESKCSDDGNHTEGKSSLYGAYNFMIVIPARIHFYEIDNSNRTLHGALLDAELLAEVYLSLSRGQDTLTLVNEDIDNLPPMPAFDASIVIKACPKSSLNTNAFWILQKRRPRQRLPGAKRLNPQKAATQQPAHKKIIEVKPQIEAQVS